MVITSNSTVIKPTNTLYWREPLPTIFYMFWLLSWPLYNSINKSIHEKKLHRHNVIYNTVSNTDVKSVE